MPQAHRYAVYLAPVGPWLDFGSQWLGRCADTGVQLPPSTDADPRQCAWTQAPRRYGLHATLKAPFRLRDDTAADALDHAMRALATQQQPFAVPLQCQSLRGFLAWCIMDPDALSRMNKLASTTVSDLDAFRAPADSAELARRQPERLSPAQRQMLDRWGYPYAFDTFTFHITLTGQLDPQNLRAAQRRLDALNACLPPSPMPVNAIGLYVEPEPGADFVVARHYGFDGATRDGAGAPFLQSHT